MNKCTKRNVYEVNTDIFKNIKIWSFKNSNENLISRFEGEEIEKLFFKIIKIIPIDKVKRGWKIASKNWENRK